MKEKYNFIKNSYISKSTDMFIPTNFNGKLIYGYNVNSLYYEELFNAYY